MRPRTFANAAWCVLAWTLAVVVWGAYVRATGAGAGCGSHWPLCDGQVVPRSPRLETLVEYTHRATSGLAFLAVAGLAAAAWRRFPRRSPVRRAAFAALLLMVTEAAIGAGLVLFELVAGDRSPARAPVMAAHLINTFLLLAALALTAHWAAGAPVPTLRGAGRRAAVLTVAPALLLAVGVSGALAALGDTLFPPASVAAALARELSPGAHALERLRLLHPLLAVAAAVMLGIQQLRLAPSRAGRMALLVVAVQLFLGGLDVVLLAPVWLQLLHLAVADLLWLAVVLWSSDALAAPAPGRQAPARATPAVPAR